MLQDVDLTVNRGELLVVIRPSGSSRSTLCRTVNRLETIDSGTITIDGIRIPAEGRALAHLRADLELVFQSFNPFAHKTVLQNVTRRQVTAEAMAPREAKAVARVILERVGVAGRADKLPAQLSACQQQRVAITCALTMRPKVMLVDEPTSALDPEMIDEVLDVMVALATAATTMVVVTHEMGVARQAARRVVFIDAGRIVDEGDPETFFTSPCSERARDFLSEILTH